MSKELKEVADRPANLSHEAFVKWIKKETGYEADLDSVTLALRLHPHFRTTDVYTGAREKLRAEREKEAAAAHARAQAAIAERLRKADEKAAALRAKLGETPEPVKRGTAKAKAVAKAPRTRKPATPKVTPEPTPEPEQTVKPTRVRRGRPQSPAVDEDDPF
jgi:hypothetical protein